MKLTERELQYIIDGLGNIMQTYWNTDINNYKYTKRKEVMELRNRFLKKADDDTVEMVLNGMWEAIDQLTKKGEK